MARGRKPNSDVYWSQAHEKFLRFMAARVRAYTGSRIPVDELVSVAWYMALRHRPGPDFSGCGTIIFRQMMRHIRNVESLCNPSAFDRGVRVNQFAEGIEDDCLDYLDDGGSFTENITDGDSCRYVLSRLKPKHADLLRQLYLKGFNRAEVARKRGCSGWNICLREREALTAARKIMACETVGWPVKRKLGA